MKTSSDCGAASVTYIPVIVTDKWLPDSSYDSSINGGHVLLTFPEQYTVIQAIYPLNF